MTDGVPSSPTAYRGRSSLLSWIFGITKQHGEQPTCERSRMGLRPAAGAGRGAHPEKRPYSSSDH